MIIPVTAVVRILQVTLVSFISGGTPTQASLPMNAVYALAFGAFAFVFLYRTACGFRFVLAYGLLVGLAATGMGLLALVRLKGPVPLFALPLSSLLWCIVGWTAAAVFVIIAARRARRDLT